MNCPQCGTGFEQAPRTAGRVKKYCTTKCSRKAFGSRKSYYVRKKTQPKVADRICNCKQCGTQFPFGHGRKYCSRKCSNKARIRVKPVKREPTPKWTNPNGVCPPSYRQQLARECYK